MPPDLEPASALASRVVGDLFDSTGERADVWRVEQLIESDRAAVREPLEKRNRELETLVCDEREVILQQRKALDGLETDLTQIRDYLPTDWTNETVRGGEAMLVVKKKWDECRRQDERIASLEAQLASAREEALREVLRDLQQFADSFLAEARKAEISGRYDQFSEHARSRALVQTCAQRVRKLLPPPAAQKEPHGR